jgi:hypothetical protein
MDYFSIDIIRQTLQIITYGITIVGVPIGIFIYYKDQKSKREAREYGTYHALDNKYIELQQLCLNHTELDVFDTPFTNVKELSEVQKKQEESILLIRISIFERAYLMYQRSNSLNQNEQWKGWEIEMKEWLKRHNFQRVWSEHYHYFDRRFTDFLNKHNAVSA